MCAEESSIERRPTLATDAGSAGDARQFEIFVSDLKEDWDQGNVTAGEIMKKAGFAPPEKYILEALDRRQGMPVAEFTSADPVDLANIDRKFFRVTPGGGGRS